MKKCTINTFKISIIMLEIGILLIALNLNLIYWELGKMNKRNKKKQYHDNKKSTAITSGKEHYIE